MQIKSLLFSENLKTLNKPQLLMLISLSTFLTGCSGNAVPEESFELPTGDYPKLVDVPDRPAYPAKNEVTAIQKNLESSRESAIIAAQPTV